MPQVGCGDPAPCRAGAPGGGRPTVNAVVLHSWLEGVGMDNQSVRPEDFEARRLAHDLLQSVVIVQSILAATRLSPPDAARLEDNLAIIATEASHMAELCQHQIDGPRRQQPIDVGRIVLGVTRRVSTMYPGALEVDIEDDLPTTLVGDPLDWERSLLNLLENGCRAAGADGKVSVRCFHTKSSLYLVVGDSGPGFGEAPAGRSSLGMVAVSKLADDHGGHIELRRGDLGGAQLSIVIPLQP